MSERKHSFRLVCTTILFSFWTVISFSQIPDGQLYGGKSNDQGVSVCVFPDGGFAIAGRTRSEGKGSTDVYVLRLDPQGQVRWKKTFGTETQDQAFWIEPTPTGGLLVTGYTNLHPLGQGRQDFYILCLDAEGDLLWEKVYGSGLLDVGFCGKPVQGGYATLGISREGDTYGNYYLARLDPNGNRLWYQIYDSPATDYGHELLQTPDGGYLLFGSASGFHFPSELDHTAPHADMLLIRTDSLGHELWRHTYGGKRHELGKAIRPATDGTYYLFGSTQSTGAGSFDLYLLHIDPAGDTLWSRTYGGPDWDYGNSMDTDTSGNLYLLGTTTTLGNTSSPDIYLLKTDPTGTPIWSLTIGGDSSDYGLCVRALPQGGCVLTGDTRSQGQGGQDAFIVYVSSDGLPTPLWVPPTPPATSTVFPNPVTSISHILTAHGKPSLGGTLRIYSSNGALISQQTITPGNLPEINRTTLKAGIYIYEWVQPAQMLLKGRFVVY